MYLCDMKKLGIDGMIIPYDKILTNSGLFEYKIFDTSKLKDRDMIVNKDGQMLIWRKECSGYLLQTNDRGSFLINPISDWKKIIY
ncbi:hypothetical protein [Leptolyngbya phage Lbo-JY46]